MVLLLGDGWEKMAGAELLIPFFFLYGCFYLPEFQSEVWEGDLQPGNPPFLQFLAVFSKLLFNQD